MNPAVAAYEPTIEELSTVFGTGSKYRPQPAEKSSIKPEYWKALLAQITKLELDRASTKVVIYDFRKQRLSVQQDFNLLDGKINDLKTDSKYSRVERLELLTKNKDVVTKSHPDAMQYLIKESIEIKMWKQYPILIFGYCYYQISRR